MADEFARPGVEASEGQAEQIVEHGGDVALSAPRGNLRRVSNLPQFRLVIAILADPGAVDRLLDRFAAAHVPGATVINGRGMSEHLSAHLSLFAGFKAAFGAVGHSQVVVTVVPAERCDEVLGLAAVAGELERPGTGIAFAIDVAAAVGLTKVQ